MEESGEVKKERIKETGPFREWVFAPEELLAEAKRFLEYVGYELEPASPIGSVCPDFRARRQTERTTYEIVGVVGRHLDAVPDACARLRQVKAVLGEAADYVIVLPPVNEHLIIEFFTEDRGKHYFELKQDDIALWLCNPDAQTMWCAIGGCRDKRFDNYFVLGKFPMGFDQIITLRLGPEEWDEE